MRNLFLLISALVLVLFSANHASSAQEAKPASRDCPVLHEKPSEADLALQQRQFPKAEELYSAMLAADPKSTVAAAGLIHVKLAQSQLADALDMATKLAAANPQDATAQATLGEVRYRRGEIFEAAKTLTAAMTLDPCRAETHMAVARYFRLAGNQLSARRQIDIAHSLSPDNRTIENAWHFEHRVPETPEETKARFERRLQDPNLTPELKAAFEQSLKRIAVRQKGGCRLVSPVPATTLKLEMLENGPKTPIFGIGLDVYLNGKRQLLQVDTGASGLLISRAAASAAGLTPEMDSKIGGIGDKNRQDIFVTHVDSIKIGNMEFQNCVVQVFEKRNPLPVDGLIGTDVFSSYAVTLDTPQRELRLALLPPRPEEAAAAATLSTEGESAETSANGGPYDSYVAPEMKDWSRVYRAGHDLIVPTNIGNAPVKLFLIDTGASTGLISPEVAREVTHVYGNSDRRIKGLSGDVNKVSEADTVTITFAHVRQELRGMVSIDLTNLSRDAGVEIGGIIGFPTLSELTISIDYRDNLIKVVYDPKHGFHSH